MGGVALVRIRLRIDMHDNSGVPVYGYVTVGYEGYAFCGSTILNRLEGDAVRVEADVNINDPVHTCGESTAGTMVATFSG